jgi:hypothetical protein
MTFIYDIFEPAGVDMYIGVGCGLVLSCVATVFSLYKPKISAVIGGISMLISAPLFIEICGAIGVTLLLFTGMILISLIAFVVGIVNCILVLFQGKRLDNLRNKAKVALSILPTALIVIIMVAECVKIYI